LFRFPRVGRIEDLATVRPVAVYTTREGLAGNDVRKLFEDRRGDVWIAAFAPDREVVTRWERTTGTFHRYSDTDGLPPLKRVQTFGEDASGSLWMGLWGGGLARYKSGRFALFTAKDGLPDRTVDGIHLDSAGRLWVSTNVAGGLYRVDDAQAERPVFVRHAIDLSRVQGPIIEDTRGRLYFNSGRGLARLDPDEDKFSYTDSDGLVSAGILSGHRDRQGNLWLGTSDGLSRLIPTPDRESVPPPVFISAIRVGTVSQSISAFGEREISGLEVGPDQNQIQIDFSGLSFAQGGPLRYQHKIDGLDPGWSEPTDQNTFYATLRSGDYRFLVRAVTADGAVSQSPATVDFRILPPVWRRWWFITIAAMLVVGGVVAFDRHRVARLKELDAALTESRVLTHQLTEQEAELQSEPVPRAGSRRDCHHFPTPRLSLRPLRRFFEPSVKARAGRSASYGKWMDETQRVPCTALR
jgi:streptogramin lyase